MVYEKVIQGKTVRLRAVEESDAEVTYKMRSDPEKTRFIHAAQGTVEDQRSYIQRQREKEGDYLFVIEDCDGNPIGMKGMYNHNPKEGTIESGRFIGYGSQFQNIEALVLCFDFAFDVLHVEKIIMSALENNAQMLSIQKKFGVEFTHREPCEGMDCDNLFSVLTKEGYAVSRPKVDGLIARFAGRK